MTSSLTWHQREDPARKRKLEKWRGPVTSSELGIRREGPHHNKEIIHARLLVSAYL